MFSPFFGLQKTELNTPIYTHGREPDLELSPSRSAMKCFHPGVGIIYIKKELDLCFVATFSLSNPVFTAVGTMCMHESFI